MCLGSTPLDQSLNQVNFQFITRKIDYAGRESVLPFHSPHTGELLVTVPPDEFKSSIEVITLIGAGGGIFSGTRRR